jgi:hypothetical protein
MQVAALSVDAAVVGLAECVVLTGLVGTTWTTEVVGTARADGDGFCAGATTLCDEDADGWVVG